MGILAGILTGYLLISVLLWMTDTVILWIIGYMGFVIFLPIAVSAWIAFVSGKVRAAQGKPKGNTAIIFMVVTGLCLAAAVSIGIAAFIEQGSNYGYGVLTLFIASPILFMELVGTVIASVINGSRLKTQRINNAYYAQYPNMQYPYMPYNNVQYGNMQGGMPYGSYPPNYQNGGYPNGNYPNNDYRQ